MQNADAKLSGYQANLRDQSRKTGNTKICMRMHVKQSTTKNEQEQYQTMLMQWIYVYVQDMIAIADW